MDTLASVQPRGESPLTKYNCVSEGFMKGYVSSQRRSFFGLDFKFFESGPDILIASFGEAGDLMHYDPKADVIHNLSRASLCDPNVRVPMGGIKLRTPPKQ
jgi:hypothetical protein